MVSLKKILVLDFDGDYREAEEGDWVDLLMEDGSSASGDIIEIKENSVILNEDIVSGEGIDVPFDGIVGVM